MKKVSILLGPSLLLGLLALTLNAASILIDPVVVQNMGVRVQKAKLGDIYRIIRALGEIEVPKTNLSVINLKYSGWIKELFVFEEGKSVKKGDPLFSIHSPELTLAQDEFILAHLNNSKTLKKSARERLIYLGLNSKEVASLENKTEAPDVHIVRSPVSGFIIAKSIDIGAKANSGIDLFKIGSLENVWVNAKVYEFDTPYVHVGTSATMELSYIPGHKYQGRVTFIDPTLDPKTRTLKVRLEFENAGLFLRPNMFATLHIQSQKKKNVLVIPSESIIHQGAQTIVFVATTPGHYEARQVRIGLSGSNNFSEVLSGINPDELVVSSGQFLLDSESQMQEAVQKMLGDHLHHKKDISKNKESKASKEEYYTCPMHPHIVSDKPSSCPICKMDLVKKTR